MVPNAVLETLSHTLRYKELSPIQKEVCAHLKENNTGNFIAKAKNGSGKSLALTLTILSCLTTPESPLRSNEDLKE